MESHRHEEGRVLPPSPQLAPNATQVFIPGGLIADDNEFGTLISASVAEEFIPRIGASTVSIRILPIGQNSTTALHRAVKAISETVKIPQVFRYIGVWQVSSSETWLVSELRKSVSLRSLFSYIRDADVESIIAHVATECLKELRVLHREHNQPHTNLRPENIHLCESGTISFSDVGIYHVLVDILPSGRSLPGVKLWPFPNDIPKLHFRADIWDLGVAFLELVDGGAAVARLLRSGRDIPSLSNPSRWSPQFNGFITAMFSRPSNRDKLLDELLNHRFIAESTSPACEAAMTAYFKGRDERIQGQFMNDTISSLFRQNSAVVRAPLINIDDISTDQFTFDHWQGSDSSRPTAELSILRMVQTAQERPLPSDIEENKVLSHTIRTLETFLDTADMI
ncbi:unnamed protein product [Chondrus crispus]|uniref:Protein kinase domain-containing protein n=1 Tax=Chondrus crispus TaxID=2769 RepID=R7QBJ5_CHOCR|nr:unnamed protein product [Chondrus crispus]CDF35877.1 unnamed protein product [Chondrus crispus]|eukprot:XP_005715696.1 unnamed protein product [Chondrus crispus]